MSTDFLFPGGILSLPRQAAQQLLRAQNPDATHLYLALLAGEDASAHFPRERLDAARSVLVGLGLLDQSTEVAPTIPEKREPEEPPQYSSGDVSHALRKDSTFPLLVEELQRRLEKLLSPSDLEILLLIYDFLALPAEVILLLANHCAARAVERYGPGRKPTLPQIRTEAFRWQRLGIDSLDAAEAHLRELDKRDEAANRLLPILGIQGREAISAERRYLERWAEQGFDDATIRLAYEKTIFRKQEMSWPYMNSILRAWHQKGFHTVAEVEAGEQKGWKRPQGQTRPAAAAAAPVAADPDRARKDFERLDRLLEQIDKEG